MRAREWHVESQRGREGERVGRVWSRDGGGDEQSDRGKAREA